MAAGHPDGRGLAQPGRRERPDLRRPGTPTPTAWPAGSPTAASTAGTGWSSASAPTSRSRGSPPTPPCTAPVPSPFPSMPGWPDRSSGRSSPTPTPPPSWPVPPPVGAPRGPSWRRTWGASGWWPRPTTAMGPPGGSRCSTRMIRSPPEVRRPTGPADVMDLMYTSGTTGSPKAVVVRYGSPRTTPLPDWNGLGFVTSSPFSTTSGVLLVYGPMAGGLSGWYLPHFDPGAWLAMIEDRRPVAAFIVPAMAQLIVAHPRFASSDLSSLAAVTIGGAPIARATLLRLGQQLPGAEILVGYGLTEFGAVTRSPSGDRGAHLGSAGKPLPGIEVRIVDDDGAEVPRGQTGEITARGSGPAAGLLQGSGGDPAHLAGRLDVQRRPRLPRRRRLPVDHRAHQGPDHPGRQQHRSGRGRRSALRPPGRGRRRGRRCPPRCPRGRCGSLGRDAGTAPTRPPPACASSCSSDWPPTRCPGRCTLFPSCPATPPARS